MPEARAASMALVSELDQMGAEHVATVEDPAVGVVKVFDGEELFGWCFSLRSEEE